MRLQPDKTFPSDEKFGLTSQLRRASVSAASNVAEGRGRTTDGEFRQFLGIAQGSTYELQTQLLLAMQSKMGEAELLRRAEDACNETSKMLAAFHPVFRS